MIRHILLIQFKATAQATDIEQVKALFQAAPQKMDGVEAVEWGENDSPEGLNQGYTHAVMMTFSDNEARDRYLPHPEHEALKAVFVPLVENIVVFDYQA